VTKATYKTYPAITSIVTLGVNVTYTATSSREFLRTYLLMQPTLSARNFSGYFWPSLYSDPTTNTTLFVAALYVHNSADIAGTNSTLQPLYDFVKNETNSGHPMTISINSNVLTDYTQLWPIPIDQVDEGAGKNFQGGSRLLPASLFEEDKVDGLVDFLLQTPLFPIFHHGESIDSVWLPQETFLNIWGL
jgi:hypothetical protein